MIVKILLQRVLNIIIYSVQLSKVKNHIALEFADNANQLRHSSTINNNSEGSENNGF